MIAINKAEKEAVVARFSDAHIVRTMVNDSRRHHYYCVEDRKILQFLKKFRNQNVVEVHQ